MKRILSLTLAILMILSVCIFTASCGNDNEEQMLYTEDTVLGTGDKEFTFTVEHIDGTKVSFTIRTDEKILSDALLEHELIEGEDGAFGLYVKKVNGITQDFDIDKTYWALYIEGEYAMEGVSSIEVTEGAMYSYKASR